MRPWRRGRPSSGQRGHTLVEVLAALAVVSIGGLAALTAGAWLDRDLHRGNSLDADLAAITRMEAMRTRRYPKTGEWRLETGPEPVRIVARVESRARYRWLTVTIVPPPPEAPRTLSVLQQVPFP